MNLRFSPAAGFALLLCLPLSLAAQDEPAPTMTSTTAMPRVDQADAKLAPLEYLSLIHISEPTRPY